LSTAEVSAWQLRPSQHVDCCGCSPPAPLLLLLLLLPLLLLLLLLMKQASPCA
jgi:hypothetical protein